MFLFCETLNVFFILFSVVSSSRMFHGKNVACSMEMLNIIMLVIISKVMVINTLLGASGTNWRAHNDCPVYTINYVA